MIHKYTNDQIPMYTWQGDHITDCETFWWENLYETLSCGLAWRQVRRCFRWYRHSPVSPTQFYLPIRSSTLYAPTHTHTFVFVNAWHYKPRPDRGNLRRTLQNVRLETVKNTRGINVLANIMRDNNITWSHRNEKRGVLINMAFHIHYSIPDSSRSRRFSHWTLL